MMAFVQRPATAFSTSPVMGQKRPRVKAEKHLDFIRSLPCLVTGTTPVDAAHIRYADRRYGKRETGKSEKPSDWFVVPLCRQMHNAQHGKNESAFWREHGIDPVRVAIALWINSGDPEIATLILSEARNP